MVWEPIVFRRKNFGLIRTIWSNSFKNEGVVFSEIFIDRTFPHDKADTRKPGAGMLKGYINNPEYDLSASFVIGDRLTDMQLAKNLGAKGIFIDNNIDLGADEVTDSALEDTIVLKDKELEGLFITCYC